MRFAVFLALMGCAGGGAKSTPAPAAVGPETQAVSVAPDASSVTVDGLTVTRPEQWEFVSADRSMGPDGRLMLVGPDRSAATRPSISFFRKGYEFRTRRPSAEQLLTTFMVAKRQELAGLEMVSEPAPMEIAGHEGASLAVRVTELTATGETTQQRAEVFAVVDGDHYWAIYALVPDGSDAGDTVASVIESLTL